MAFRLGINFETNVATLINDMTRASRSVQSTSQQISRSLTGATSAAKTLIGVFGVGFSVRGIVSAADSFANLSNRIKVVSADSNEVAAAFAGIQRIAMDTNSSIEATTQLYSRLRTATSQMGLTQAEVLKVTQAYNQTLRISGATGTEAAAAALQFAQALGSGRLAGDELRSLLENNNRAARLLADGLGVSVGALKDMGANGELTADKITNILLKSFEQLNEEASKIAPTIGGAFKEIGDQFSAAFFNRVNDGIGTMSSELDSLSGTAQRAGDALGGLVTQTINYAGALSIMFDQRRKGSELARMIEQMHGPGAKDAAWGEKMNPTFDSYKGVDMKGTANAAREYEKVFTDMNKTATANATKGGGVSLAPPAIAADTTAKLGEASGAASKYGQTYIGVRQNIRDTRMENSQLFSSFIDDVASASDSVESLRGVLLNTLKDFVSGLASISSGGSAGGSLGGIIAGKLGGLISGGSLVSASGTAAFSSRSMFSLAPSAAAGAFGPGFARGGVANKPSIFGEAGPEAAVPLPDGRSIPVDINGGGGGGTYYIDATGADPAALARVEAAIREVNGSIEKRAVSAVQDKFRRSGEFGRT